MPNAPRSMSVSEASRSSMHRKASIDQARRKASTRRNSDLLLDPLSHSQVVHMGNHSNQGPIENVRRLVMSWPEDPPPMVIELLHYEPHGWQQVARWVKYEQEVEGDSTRLSKPKITLLRIQALLQVKNCLRKGIMLLDAPLKRYPAIVDAMGREWVSRGKLSQDMADVVTLLLREPTHHVKSMPDRDSFVHVDSFPGENSHSDHHQFMEAAVIFVGRCDFLVTPISGFVRLRDAQSLHPRLPDQNLPVRFLFFLLSPGENYSDELIAVGRALGALFADPVFRRVALSCTESHTLADTVEEFMSQMVAVPPLACAVDDRWEPHEREHRRVVGEPFGDKIHSHEESHRLLEEEHGITRTGRLFGGLVQDIRDKSGWYVSDYVDFFSGRLSQSIAATIVLFFANLTSIITFGAVMERILERQMASMESILCGCLSGVVFALFSGQPLNVLSATGPTLVFEKILFDFCRQHDYDFLSFRCCVGIWITVFLLILVATDMSALVGLITRFTEEAFASLISLVFIIQALEKLIAIYRANPIVSNVQALYASPCVCQLPSNVTVPVNLGNFSMEECSSMGGTPSGLQCSSRPEVFLMSVLLTLGTFSMSVALSKFRHTNFFTSKLRNVMADFGVVVSIVVMTLLSQWVGLPVPTLTVPMQIKPTIDRSWFVDPLTVSPPAFLLAAIPAALYSILIVMDQQITAVIINRPDNMLKKGHGYHLDLLVISLIVLVSSFLGLPFFVAATVLSVMHIDSLRLHSEVTLPGETPRVNGIKEQRLTALLAHLLIGLSVFLIPIIKLVPLPVLIGVFLYMGVVSLVGQQFAQRVALMFTPVKHQPDHPWLRNVRMQRVHLFTTLQLVSLAALFAVKYSKRTSMLFPLMLVLIVAIRILLLSRVFSRHELSALDDIPPSLHSVMTKKTVEFDLPKMEQLSLIESGSNKPQ